MMKATVTVAAVQMEVKWLEPETNARAMADWLARATAQAGVDLVVFPELANSGYVTSRDPEFMRRYYRAAEPIPGPTTRLLGEAARQHGVHLVVGLLEAHPTVAGTMSNSAVLIGADGAVAGVYRKTHVPGEEKHYFCAGSQLPVFDTPLGRLGLLVCADNSFPEAARVLALRGAEILVVPYNVRRMPNLELYVAMTATRAYENQVFVVACNRVGQDGDAIFQGRTAIAAPSGEILARARAEEEGLVRASLDAELLVRARLFQSRYRDRRPDLYRGLGEQF
jgi:predicted amidohydrolase